MDGPSKNKKRKGSVDGLKGYKYEMMVILLFMIRAIIHKVNFKLSSNIKEYGNFDDLVAECTVQGKDGEDLPDKLYCLQSKYISTINNITEKILLCESKGKKHFSLKTYYEEWFKSSKNPNNPNCEFLFFTKVSINCEKSGVKWCNVPKNHTVCKLFNTREDNCCVKKISICQNKEILNAVNNDKEFLRKIYFVSNQCNLTEFDKLLQDELINLIGNHNITNLYLQLKENINSWFSNDDHTKGDEYTNSKFLHNIWEIALSEIPCLKLKKHLTERCKNYIVTDIKRLEIMQNIDRNSCLSIKSEESSAFLALLEVYQTISDNSNIYCNNFLMVKLNELGKVLELFKYCIDLIIIDCSKTYGHHEEQVLQIEKILTENKEKKAVFIFANNSKVIEPQSSFSVKHKFNFELLTPESQDYLIDHNIIFQGSDVKLEELVQKQEIYNIIDCDTVVKILKNEPVIVGEKLEGLKKETEICYIERSFYHTHKDSNYILEKTDFPDILLVSIKQLSDLGQYQNTFVNYINVDQNTNSCKFYHLSESREESKNAFKKIASMFSEKNVHWLEARENMYVWLDTKGSLENIKEPGTNNIERGNVVSDDIVINNANHINIIVDSAGMGKTTVLYKIAEKLKQRNPTCWILHYDLNTKNMDKILNEISESYKYERLSATKLLKTYFVSKLSKFEQELFDYLFINDRIIFCFDGFDEIHSKNEIIFIKVIKTLIQGGAKQVWVTSREHRESTLQEYLPSLPLKLLPINTKNQIDFCVKYFKYKVRQSQLDEAKVREFSSLLIKSVLLLDKSIHELIGIPMLTNMLSSINLEQCIKFCKQKGEKIGYFDEYKNIYELYKKFFDCVIARYYQEKTNLPLYSKTAELHCNNVDFKKQHMYHAVMLLLHDKSENITGKVKCKPKYNSRILAIGIIIGIEKASTKFLHLTFAEFLFAWFISEQLGPVTIIRDMQALLDEVLYEARWKIVRKFLNCAELKHTYKYNPLHNVTDKKLTSLQIAAEEGNCNIAEFTINCLEENKDIKHWISLSADKISGIYYDRCYTALHIAAEYGHEKFLAMLLKHGADIEVRTRKGNTTLMIAAKNGNVRMVTLLLDHGADIHYKNNDGDTALMSVARQVRHVGLNAVRLMLYRGADINQKNVFAETALKLAASREKVETLNLLLDRGADVNHKNNEGITALTSAVSECNLETVQLLQARGAYAEDEYKNGCTLLLYSACNKHHEVLTYFMGKGKYNIHHTDNKGWSALHYAASYGHCLNVQSLLTAHAVINCQDKKGNTPLHLACGQLVRIQCVQYLVQRGARCNIKNCDGKTARDLCNDGEIRNWLQENHVIINTIVPENNLTNW